MAGEPSPVEGRFPPPPGTWDNGTINPTRWPRLFAAVMLAGAVACSPGTGADPASVSGVRSGSTAGPSAAHDEMAGRRGAAATPPGAVHPRRPRGKRVRAAAPAARAAVTPDCRAASAADQYRDGSGHDHLDISQHHASCRMEQVAFLSLVDELGSEVLGEMDIKAGIAAVAVTFPQAGILFFDVRDPRNPVFLSRYRSSECEGQVIDVNCGAFVDLSADGKWAFLSLQQITLVPGRTPDLQAPGPAPPGVELVDATDPRRPKLADVLPIASEGGVHTSRSHVIPEGLAPDAAPGEYVFSVANGLGIAVSRVEPGLLGARMLAFLQLIPIDDVHDMFIQNDPIDRRTYMYVAAGFDSGFYVFDVTDPGGDTPLKAEWDLTPRCERDWYSHTIDVTTRGSKRYVTLPAELFDLGKQSEEDQAEGCGTVFGNGDRPGPLWIVDASDLGALGPADALDDAAAEEATDAELERRSQEALVATWTNAADHPGGYLTFSPHNQQIVGDRIYLSGYHSGVTVLDASAAFAGQKGARPVEVGFIVPSGDPVRPLYAQAVAPAIAGFSKVPATRPLVWDQVFYDGHVFAADMLGGFYSFSAPG